MQEALAGIQDPSHPSTLHWPSFPNLRTSSWNHWKLFLQHFTRCGKLHQLLSPWSTQTHQLWQWYQSTMNQLFRLDHSTSSWTEFHQIPTSRPPRTPTYNLSERQPCDPLYLPGLCYITVSKRAR